MLHLTHRNLFFATHILFLFFRIVFLTLFRMPFEADSLKYKHVKVLLKAECVLPDLVKVYYISIKCILNGRYKRYSVGYYSFNLVRMA